MRYNLEDTMGDQGFLFLERLHNPIFLIHKNGTIKKINGAGRKLLKIAHLTLQQVDDLIQSVILARMSPEHVEIQRIPTCQNQHLKIVSKQIGRTDYILIELMR